MVNAHVTPFKNVQERVHLIRTTYTFIDLGGFGEWKRHF